MRGSLFPLKVKCQNHERVTISPISPIFVVHVLSPCQDMGHQNSGNRDPLMVLALHPGKTLKGSLFPLFPLKVKSQNHERVLFPLFPLFWWSMSCHLVKTWATKIGEIGTLSWFWHFTHENAERVPFPISPKREVPKPWEGPYFPYFPYFGGPCLDRMNRHWPPK